MIRANPTDKEAFFQLHELFFSRTNKQGVIQSGNEVFVRVSGFSKSELYNSPHKIIRHPDMPRSVFKLFWEMIQSDRPIGAYVKNMAKNGSYYWVFAAVFPIEGGYLSLRLKPSSSLFPKVAELYRFLLEEEVAKDPATVQKQLLGTLKEIGFESYEHFMTHALVEELHSRDQFTSGIVQVEPKTKDLFFQTSLNMGRRCRSELAKVFLSLIPLLKNGNSLKACAEEILSRFSDLTFLSINMAIGAAKVGQEGRGLAEVSNGFRMMAHEIQMQVQLCNEKLVSVIQGISDCQFEIGCSRLQIDMVQAFVEESISGSDQKDSNSDQEFLQNYVLLLGLCLNSNSKVYESFQGLAKVLDELIEISVQVLSTLNGLAVIRLTGKVEASRLKEEHRISFENHIEEMTVFVDSLSGQLRKVHNLGGDSAEGLKRSLACLISARKDTETMYREGQREMGRQSIAG